MPAWRPTDGADILGNPGANECGFVTPPAGANNGQVDLNSDTVITVLGDSCANGCFFGLDIVAGLVQSSGPDTIALAPATATNTVGDDHPVTATVEDEFGNPVAGESVHFAVTGAGTPDPAAGDDTTGAAGAATFTFTNEAPGTNTITACVDADDDLTCDGGELSTTATRRGKSTECPGFEGDPRNQVVGTSGADDLSGTSGRDIICGLGGNDELRGLGGNDLLLGAGGADLILGGAGADEARGGGGGDELRGGDGGDSLLGQNGSDSLFGQKGPDFLNGGAGNDSCNGGDGADTLRSC